MVLRRLVVISRHTEIRQLGSRIAQDVMLADDAIEAADIVSSFKPDIILVDALLPTEDIKTLLDKTDNNLDVPIVIVGNGDGKCSRFSQFTHYYLPSVNDHDRLWQILNSIPAQSASRPSAGRNGFFADELAASVSMAGKFRGAPPSFEVT